MGSRTSSIRLSWSFPTLGSRNTKASLFHDFLPGHLPNRRCSRSDRIEVDEQSMLQPRGSPTVSDTFGIVRRVSISSFRRMFARLGQLEAKMGNSSFQFFRTHPSSESRVKVSRVYCAIHSNSCLLTPTLSDSRKDYQRHTESWSRIPNANRYDPSSTRSGVQPMRSSSIVKAMLSTSFENVFDLFLLWTLIPSHLFTLLRSIFLFAKYHTLYSIIHTNRNQN